MNAPIAILDEEMANEPLTLIRMIQRCFDAALLGDQQCGQGELRSFYLAAELIEKDIVELRQWIEDGRFLVQQVFPEAEAKPEAAG